MEIFGQIIGFIFAGFLFWKAYKFYDNNKNAAGHLLGVIAALIFLCSIPAFQGFIKAWINSKVSSKLAALGQQVNEVQSTTGEMQGELKNHQKEIDKHQKELDVVQAKVREAESNVFSQQTDITNQFRQISKVQSDLAMAQTNIFSQQEKLTNVESLVNILFSNTEDEEFSASDTNKVIILKLGGVQMVVFRLKFAPIPNSIQAMLLQGHSGQTPLLPTMGQYVNILTARFYNEGNLNGVSFHFRYIKNTRENNLIKNMVIVNTNTVSLDGVSFPF
jgi:hypothetical protein